MHWKSFNIIILLCFSLTISAFAQPEQDVRVYIARYNQLAISEQQRTGVPAAIKLAQGIYESAAGNSDLASRSNNHFGIKCKSSWRGDTVLHDDDLRQECFRKYPSVEKSYMDHSDFLKGSPRYANLFKLEPSDYMGWATGLKQAGYATNPAYVRKITDIIERYNLQQYTLEALKGTRATTSGAEKEWLAATPLSDSAQELTLAEYKGLKGFWASKGQLLLDKAVLYNVKYSKLLYLNDLADAPLPNDMFIFTEPKRVVGQSESHLVREGESMHLISQKEAIRLDSLMAYNHLLPNQEVMPGERVVLQGGKISYPKTRDNQVAGKPEVRTIIGSGNQASPVTKVDTPKVVTPVVANVVAPKVNTPAVSKIDTPVIANVVAPKVITPSVPKQDTPKVVTPVVANVVAPKVNTPAVSKLDTPNMVKPVLVKVDTPKNSPVIMPVDPKQTPSKGLAVAVPKSTTPLRDTIIKIRRTDIPQTAIVKKDVSPAVSTARSEELKTQPVLATSGASARIDTQMVVRRTQAATSSDILDIEKARRTEALLSSNPLTPVKTTTAPGNGVVPPSNTPAPSSKVGATGQQAPVKRTYNDPTLSAPVKDLKKKFDQIVYDPAPIPLRDTVKSPVITSVPKKETTVQKPALELPPHLRIDTSKPKPTPPPVRMRPAEVIVQTTNYDEPNVSDTVKNLRKKFDLILNTPLPERPYKESPPVQTPKPAVVTTTVPAAKPTTTPKATTKTAAKPNATSGTKTPVKSKSSGAPASKKTATKPAIKKTNK